LIDDAKHMFARSPGVETRAHWRPSIGSVMALSHVALMRGHGFASAGRTLIEVARMSVYLPRNARTLMRAQQLGGTIKYLSQRETDAGNRGYRPYSTETTWWAWILGEYGRLWAYARPTR
jgi:ribulose-5-phosphate 4-epimerase/fuculose-1-phosphate aldolase